MQNALRHATIMVGLIVLTAKAACADDVPASAAANTEQAQARQFGIFFGGMASQYDLCVKKGLIAKSDQSAEAVAKSILQKMRQFSKEPDQSAYVQEGWDAIKKEVAKHESEYTLEKCSSVAKEWATMVATMTPQ